MDKCDEDVKTLTLNYKAFMREIKEDKNKLRQSIHVHRSEDSRLL